jgi:hypothetical protein
MSVDQGHRYLVSNPSNIIIENELTFLSSDNNIIYNQSNLFSPLLKSFETWVWILTLCAIVCVSIIISMSDSIMNGKNKITFIKILENNLFFHQRSILRQSKSLFMNKNQINNSFQTPNLLPMSFVLIK